MCTSVQAGSATSWTLLLGFESLRRETAGLVSNGSALGMQDREWAGETSNSLLKKKRKGSSAYKLVTDESSGRFHFSQLFRKRKCAFSHELSLHFVKLKTNCSLLWVLRDSEWKKEIVIQCMCKLSKLHLRHLQCELGKWVGKSQSRQSSAGATYFCPCPTERVRESRDRAWTESNSHSPTEPRPSQVYALRLCHTLAVSMVTTYLPGVSNVRHWEEWILFISSPSRISKYSSWSFLLGAVRKKSGVRLLQSAPVPMNEIS